MISWRNELSPTFGILNTENIVERLFKVILDA
jgi:hypothetical protein